MAAQLKNYDEQQWSQSVPSKGLEKLAEAVKNPKQPTEALKRLMASKAQHKAQQQK